MSKKRTECPYCKKDIPIASFISTSDVHFAVAYSSPEGSRDHSVRPLICTNCGGIFIPLSDANEIGRDCE